MRKGKCYNCGDFGWINVATLREAFLGELCADCFEVVPHDKASRNRTIKGSGSDHNDPALDNAVRALEGD